jgi:aerotaxis receptor
MPKIAFKEMWNVIKKGDEWEGYVKNMRKDGAFFWAVMYITAKFNDKGEIIGFIALRKKPGLLTLEEMKVKYKDLILIEEISKKYKLN